MKSINCKSWVSAHEKQTRPNSNGKINFWCAGKHLGKQNKKTTT